MLQMKPVGVSLPTLTGNHKSFSHANWFFQKNFVCFLRVFFIPLEFFKGWWHMLTHRMFETGWRVTCDGPPGIVTPLMILRVVSILMISVNLSDTKTHEAWMCWTIISQRSPPPLSSLSRMFQNIRRGWHHFCQALDTIPVPNPTRTQC